MTYPEFAHSRPVLYGQMIHNGKCKIGTFKPVHHSMTNSTVYQYYSPTGHKGRGGFTLKRAFSLFETRGLSTDPAMGNPDNYVN